MGIFNKADTAANSQAVSSQAVSSITEAFNKGNIKYKISSQPDSSLITVGFNGKGIPDYQIHYIILHKNNDVSVRIIDIATVPDDKKAAILELINNCNSNYRFAKFILTDESKISMQYDMPLRGGNYGDVALEIAVRFNTILGEVYPKIMKCLWN